jgi:hypothetical protein
MTFLIEHDGSCSEFPNDALLVFVDETGHEDFADPSAPFFGLAGCVCAAGDYSKVIDVPWQPVEQAFPNDMLPLHATDLRPSEMQPEQFTALDRFFAEGSFGRFATVAKRGIENETKYQLLNVLVQQTFQRILNLIKKSGRNFSQLIIVIEHCERLDAQYADYFSRYNLSRKDGSLVPAFVCTQAKSSGEDFMRGLCVADFLAHTAGSMSRTTKGGQRRATRRDFNSAFQNDWADHIFLDTIRGKPGG